MDGGAGRARKGMGDTGTRGRISLGCLGRLPLTTLEYDVRTVERLVNTMASAMGGLTFIDTAKLGSRLRTFIESYRTERRSGWDAIRHPHCERHRFEGSKALKVKIQ